MINIIEGASENVRVGIYTKHCAITPASLILLSKFLFKATLWNISPHKYRVSLL